MLTCDVSCPHVDALKFKCICTVKYCTVRGYVDGHLLGHSLALCHLSRAGSEIHAIKYASLSVHNLPPATVLTNNVISCSITSLCFDLIGDHKCHVFHGWQHRLGRVPGQASPQHVFDMSLWILSARIWDTMDRTLHQHRWCCISRRAGHHRLPPLGC